MQPLSELGARGARRDLWRRSGGGSDDGGGAGVEWAAAGVERYRRDARDAGGDVELDRRVWRLHGSDGSRTPTTRG